MTMQMVLVLKGLGSSLLHQLQLLLAPLPRLTQRMRWKLREKRRSADLGVLVFTFSATGHPTPSINIYRTISL